MVEEFGVAGKLARLTKVIGRADEAFSEEMLPNAVDHDAGGERVFRIGNPLCEFQPT